MPNQEAQSAKDADMRKSCEHPPSRYYTWYAYDGTLCVACCECGKVLRGGV